MKLMFNSKDTKKKLPMLPKKDHGGWSSFNLIISSKQVFETYINKGE